MTKQRPVTRNKFEKKMDSGWKTRGPQAFKPLCSQVKILLREPASSAIMADI